MRDRARRQMPLRRHAQMGPAWSRCTIQPPSPTRAVSRFPTSVFTQVDLPRHCVGSIELPCVAPPLARGDYSTQLINYPRQDLGQGESNTSEELAHLPVTAPPVKAGEFAWATKQPPASFTMTGTPGHKFWSETRQAGTPMVERQASETLLPSTCLLPIQHFQASVAGRH